MKLIGRKRKARRDTCHKGLRIELVRRSTGGTRVTRRGHLELRVLPEWQVLLTSRDQRAGAPASALA